MRTRHPFADVREHEPRQTVTIVYEGPDGKDASVTFDAPPLDKPTPAMHQGENRRTRRKATATFTGPEELGPNLRRRLLEKRQAKALGTMDVELRRLQRRKAQSK